MGVRPLDMSLNLLLPSQSEDRQLCAQNCGCFVTMLWYFGRGESKLPMDFGGGLQLQFDLDSPPNGSRFEVDLALTAALVLTDG